MPDITMCRGDKCKVNQTCHRYRAKPSPEQSWFSKEPGHDHNCRYYWPTRSNPDGEGEVDRKDLIAWTKVNFP